MKKSKLFIAASLACLPLIANATLTNYNYTNEDSSVRVTSGKVYPCSSDAGVYTPKANPDGTPGYSFVKDTEIQGLCLGSANKTCTADIYNTSNCTGDKVAEATLDLNTKRVTGINVTDPRYVFDIESNGTVLRVRYAG